MLSRILPGKTLLYGETARDGPYRMRLNADGSAAVLRGHDRIQFDTGLWSVNADQFCREWKTSEPRRMCFAVVSDGSKIQLFDHVGLMYIDAHIIED